MGLDMYLNVGKGDNAYEIGYWRKANAIHKFFVDKLQNGEDDQRESKIDKSTFEELFEKVSAIREEYIKLDADIDNLNELSSEELEEYSSEELECHLVRRSESWDYLLPKYKEKFDEFCKNILPTSSGCFFGSTSYDIYYIWNAIYTYELIKGILDDWESNDEEDNNYYYTCWW
jgi:hypothetical protein